MLKIRRTNDETQTSHNPNNIPPVSFNFFNTLLKSLHHFKSITFQSQKIHDKNTPIFKSKSRRACARHEFKNGTGLTRLPFKFVIGREVWMRNWQPMRFELVVEGYRLALVEVRVRHFSAFLTMSLLCRRATDGHRNVMV